MTPRIKETLKQVAIGFFTPIIAFIAIMSAASLIMWENTFMLMIEDGHTWMARAYLASGLFIGFVRGTTTYVDFAKETS